MKFAILLATFVAVISNQTCFAQVTHLTESQWVKTTDGNLVGRVILPAKGGAASAVENAVVAIVGKDGEIQTASAKTDSKGRFSIAGVKPGVYAMTARADYVFACCAMHVLDNDAHNQYPSSVEIAAANIDFTTVKTAIIRYLPPKVREFDYSIAKANLDGLSPLVTGTDFFRVAQSSDGMRGRLHQAGAEVAKLDQARLTNVFIMINGPEAARAVTNEKGEFTIKQLDPGHYSLMAIGPDGLGMVGFELVSADTDESVATTADGKTLVGIGAGGCCQEFAMQIAPPCEQIISDVVISEQVVAAPCDSCGQAIDSCGCQPVDPCGCGVGVPLEGAVEAVGTPVAGGYGGGGGGYYGGGGGGGGGFAGGGGLGTIAGLAGLAGVIVAVADDDDAGSGGIVVPEPISPAIP